MSILKLLNIFLIKEIPVELQIFRKPLTGGGITIPGEAGDLALFGMASKIPYSTAHLTDTVPQMKTTTGRFRRQFIREIRKCLRSHSINTRYCGCWLMIVL